jgi:hypothetical protein
MLENGEIAEELLTVSEVAAALKVPASWVYERTRRPSAPCHTRATFSARNTTKTSGGKLSGWNLSTAWIWTWTERRAVLAQGCLQRRPFI